MLVAFAAETLLHTYDAYDDAAVRKRKKNNPFPLFLVVVGSY